MAKKTHISVTDIRSFLDCRLSWHFSSSTRLNLTIDRPYAPFVLGQGVHEAIDCVHRNEELTHEDCFDQWAEKELVRLGELDMSPDTETKMHETLELGRQMTWHYDLWLARNPPDYEIVETEFRLRVPLSVEVAGHQAYFVGRTDGLAVDRWGNLLLLEYKTAKSLYPPDAAKLDFQGLAYLAAANRLGSLPGKRTKAKGVAYTFLRKRAAKPPKLLQSGALSVNKRQGTSYELYTLALEELSLDPAAYQEMLLYLTTQCQYFQRVTITPPVGALEAVWKDLQAIAAEMLNPLVPIYPSPGTFGWRCNRCWFQDPCQLHRQGIDPMPLLQTAYRKKERRQ